MDNEKVNVLLAKDARKIVEESTFLRKTVYKWIKEAAIRNNNSICIGKDTFDSDVFNNVLEELKSVGYSVKIFVNSAGTVCEDSIIISW